MTSNSRVEKIEYDEIIFSWLQHGMDSTEIFKIIGKPDSLKLLVDVVGDSSILLCYKNMEATLLNKKLYFFQNSSQKYKNDYPEIKIGDNINDFLKKYSNLKINNYNPSGVQYQIYSINLDKYESELRIVVKDNTIKKFYSWIPN